MKYKVWVSTPNEESPFYTDDEPIVLAECDEFVQITYNEVRVGPNGDSILTMDEGGDGFWHPTLPYGSAMGGWQAIKWDTSIGYSDIVIEAVPATKQGSIQHGDDPVESEGEK